jgi:AcrR family transcriptional regulator
MGLYPDFFESPVPRRADQKERTRALLLATALAFMRNGGEEAVTIRAVAADAEVTERTVYRYFRSRDVLLRSVRQRMEDLVGPPPPPKTADALVKRPRELFARLAREPDLVPAYLHDRARRLRRRRPDEQRQQAMIECVREQLDYLDEGSLRRCAAIADLLTSPDAWQYLQEFWDLSSREAAKAATEALEILLDRRSA